MQNATTYGIDDRLMAVQAANELRRRQEEGRRMEANADQETEAKTEEPQSFRERLMAKRRAEQKAAIQKEKKEIHTPATDGTDWLLRLSWYTLIPSFGLTLIWINIHAFMRMIPGSRYVFSKLGSEWVPKSVKKAGGYAAKSATRTAGLIERSGLFMVDITALSVVLAFIIMVMIIIDTASYVFGIISW